MSSPHRKQLRNSHNEPSKTGEQQHNEQVAFDNNNTTNTNTSTNPNAAKMRLALELHSAPELLIRLVLLRVANDNDEPLSLEFIVD